MSSKGDIWTVRRLLELTTPDGDRPPAVTLPKFQRSIVWSEDQKRQLVHSLLIGYPIGSLLLYRERPKDTYLLVDGLQRTTAIREYSQNPLRWVLVEYLPEDKVEALLRAAQLPSDYTDKVRDAIVGWLQRTKGLALSDGYEPYKLVKHLRDVFGERLDYDKPEVQESAVELLESIRQRVDISDREVPVIIYEGDKASLPEIFELLNSRGTELGKYDIYAATWSDEGCVIHDPEVRDAIKRRYQYLIEEKGYVIDGVGPDLHLDGYSLFEYLFGLGKVLSRRFHLLFEDGTESADPNPIAFTLATLAHGFRISSMPQLPQRLRERYNVPEAQKLDLTRFESAVLDACETVQDILEPYLIKLNSQGKRPILVHAELQMAALISAVCVLLYYPIEWERKDRYQETLSLLRQTVPQHYLYDLVASLWRGSGDTRAYERVWGSRNERSQSYEPSNYYLTPIPREQWDGTLDTWFNRQISKEQVERGHIDKSQKLFLSYLYSHQLHTADLKKQSFEIEHLVPVSRIRKYLSGAGDSAGWPISAVGNLALFPRALNREKSGKTIAEYLEVSRAEMEFDPGNYLFCDPTDVPAPNPNNPAAVERERFIEFTKRNFAAMKRRLLDDILKV